MVLRLSATERDPIKAADWLEAELVYAHGSAVSLERLRSQATFEADLDDNEDRDEHDLGSAEDVPSGPTERLVSNAAIEIRRRLVLCDGTYPFSFDRGRLTWNDPSRLADPYIVCLLASDREFYRSGDDTAKVFEHLTTQAMGSFLGGEAVRFGAPRDTMPPLIDEAISRLAQLTSAEKLNGWSTYGTDQDLGVDVVGWKEFSDDHNNRLQIFAQCATGEGWLEEKKGEPNLEMWSGLLLWGTPPLRALAIPYVVNDKEKWQRNIAGRLLLDRVRIVEALRGIELREEPIPWDDWVAERVDWVNKERD